VSERCTWSVALRSESGRTRGLKTLGKKLGTPGKNVHPDQKHQKEVKAQGTPRKESWSDGGEKLTIALIQWQMAIATAVAVPGTFSPPPPVAEKRPSALVCAKHTTDARQKLTAVLVKWW
jgi:hypothetical protein